MCHAYKVDQKLGHFTEKLREPDIYLESQNLDDNMGPYIKYIDRSPAILTSDDFIRSNKIIRTKWLIY